MYLYIYTQIKKNKVLREKILKKNNALVIKLSFSGVHWLLLDSHQWNKYQVHIY